jgi:hypothetical protein
MTLITYLYMPSAESLFKRSTVLSTRVFSYLSRVLDTSGMRDGRLLSVSLLSKVIPLL